MKPSEINEQDKTMKEIENTLETIKNFRKGNYKEIKTSKDIDTDKLNQITEKTGVSKVKAIEMLGKDLLKEEKD